MVAARIQRSWERVQRLPVWMLDVLITVVAGTVLFASTFSQEPGQVYEDRGPLAFLLVAAVVLPYLLRSRYPFVVFTVSTAALITYVALGYNEGALSLLELVGMYTVGARCRPRLMLAAVLVLLTGLSVLLWSDKTGFDIGDLFGNVAFFLAAVMLGWTVQSRRQRLEALEARAEALEREQVEEARRAVADERLRIAQELHDVMAHSMSVIAVQAGAGMTVIDKDPDQAKRTLENISQTSRSTLAELRRLLGVLREDEDETYAPTPGLADLPALAREVTDAGVEVDLAVDTDADELPPGVDLTGYRIVQEALTNVLKHAGPARASVRVGHDAGILRIEVTDDGRGVNGRSDGTGHGLLGMRERVAVYGGSLDAGPRAGGGFRLVADLPYRDRAGTEASA